ncbi:MAG: hypothetical protein R3D28_24200 [Geminicoccaceae bacterium]
MDEAKPGALALLREEGALVFGALTTAVLMTVGAGWFELPGRPVSTVLLFLWIFAAMLWCAFGVVRHADSLADLLGEPYGTLILTLSVISIEVSLMAAIMLTGEANPTLARDTMLAVIMIVLNALVGISLLIGGLRHGEQEFNLQGARAFLAVLIPLATMTLILPRFTKSTDAATLSTTQEILFGAITIALYGIFLAVQTGRHRGFFMQPGPAGKRAADAGGHGHGPVRSVPFHAALLVLTMLPIVLLSKKLALLVDFGIATLAAPVALGGVLVAILVLAPEGLAAVHAARANQVQRSVNICLGSALATIGLTVPAVLLISLVTGEIVVLGLEEVEIVLLLLTLVLSMLTFGAVRTNMLQGVVHLVIFLVYLVLVFNP